MKYLKKFNQHSEYETYMEGGEVILPNVSFCDQENEVHYNPIVPPMNMITYQATEKLTETTSSTSYPTSGLKTNVFSGSSGQLLTMKSHTFENGVGTIEFDGDIAIIGRYAFYGCNGLTSVTIPNGVTSIGVYAFGSCHDLTSITIPNSVTSIAQYAFDITPWWNAYSADTSHHYGNIIYINDVAYQATSKAISSCTFREGTVGIGGLAFDRCTNLTSVNIPNSVTSMGGSAFSNCSGLTSITIGNGVTKISDSAFSNCSNLTSITIPNNVTSIGTYAFNGSGLASIEIPNSVTKIDEATFRYCRSLTSVTIPDSVTNVGSNAFAYCESLTSITSLATTAPMIQSSTFQSVKSNGTLAVPSGSSGYDVWMGTSNYYLGLYGWTKVEQ